MSAWGALFCFLVLNLIRVESVRFRRRHPNHRAAAPELELIFPLPENRDPHKCEPFEEIGVPEEGGCQQVCKLSGRLGNLRIADSTSRRPTGYCRPPGYLCKVRFEDRERLNATTEYGQCSENCECLPLSFQEMRDRRRDLLFNEYMTFGSTVVNVESSEDLKKLPFAVKLSPAESRNQERCERFETPVMHGGHHPGSYVHQCRASCRVHGSIGSVNFHLPSRVLNRNKPDGSRCHLSVQRSSDVFVFGAEQSVDGRCRAGFCVTEDAQVIQDRILSALKRQQAIAGASSVSTNAPNFAPTAAPITSPQASPTYEYVTLSDG